jgi:hypothetical protein
MRGGEKERGCRGERLQGKSDCRGKDVAGGERDSSGINIAGGEKLQVERDFAEEERMQGRQTAGGAKLQSKRGFMGRKIGCRGERKRDCWDRDR